MMVEPTVLAARVSRECRQAAAALRGLQDSLTDEFVDDRLTARAIADLQVLDRLTQTLADLGRVIDAVADEIGQADCDRAVPRSVFAAAQQASLRGRLGGEEVPRPVPDIELFDQRALDGDG